MKNILLSLILLNIYLCSCKSKLSERDSIILDTLKVGELSLPDKVKTELLDEYDLKFGIAIPKYFFVRDSLPIDLNGDNLVDTIVFLSLVVLEDSKYLDYATVNEPKRILVEIINFGGNSKIRNVYNNLTSNIGGVLSGYSGMFLTEKGFEIHHQSGNRYSWNYVAEFSTGYRDSIFLIRLEKVCSFDGVDEKKEYFFDKKSIQEIDVADSIKNNCNCDDMWMNLEKTKIE